MGLILPKSVFIHIPKTGGTTVRKLCERMGLSRGETGHGAMSGVERQHSPFGWMKGEVGARRAFATVRRTLDWYQSQWMHKTRTGEGSGIISDENYRAEFAAWVRHVTVSHSGHYGWFLNHMLAGSDALLIPTHDLFDGLKITLERLHESFEWAALDDSWVMNAAGAEERSQAVWTSELVALVQVSDGVQLYPDLFLEQYEENLVRRESGITV